MTVLPDPMLRDGSAVSKVKDVVLTVETIMSEICTYFKKKTA